MDDFTGPDLDEMDDDGFYYDDFEEWGFYDPFDGCD